MDYRRLGNHIVVRIDRGEEVLEKLAKVCEEEKIQAGSFVGLGAADRVTVGLFDVEAKQYEKHEFTGAMEITSLVGNISTMNGENYIHSHITVCNEQMHVFGGHLNECHISGTCEMTITVIDAVIERELDENVGLNTYKFI